jgi:lysophospholipase L1-like esterase
LGRLNGPLQCGEGGSDSVCHHRMLLSLVIVRFRHVDVAFGSSDDFFMLPRPASFSQPFGHVLPSVTGVHKATVDPLATKSNRKVPLSTGEHTVLKLKNSYMLEWEAMKSKTLGLSVMVSILVLCGSALFPRLTHAGTYNLVEDDSFQRADTTPGSGANSTTGIGNGWVDFIGNVYEIQNDNVFEPVLHGLPRLDGFYHDASTSDSFQNGKVDIYSAFSTSGDPYAQARFNPSNGGSGYAALFYQGNSFYLYKIANGVQQVLVSQYVITGAPSNAILELVVQDADSNDTVLTVNLYDPSNPNIVTNTYSYVDSVSPLQTPGYWGAGGYGMESISRVQTYNYVPSGPIIPGTIGAVLSGASGVTSGGVLGTSIKLTSASATSGFPPYTYQWQRSTASTTGFTNIPNATSTALTDTGLSPGTTYFYRMDVKDSESEEATTTPLRVNTANNHIIGFIGDSITNGSGSDLGNTLSDGPATVIEYLTLQNAGYSIGAVKDGIGGSQTSDWQPGGTNFVNALAAFQPVGVDTVSIMLGTNDALNGHVAPSTFEANLQNDVNGLLTPGTGITRVILNYPPALGNGDSTGESLMLQYQPLISAIASSTPGVYLGDTSFYTWSLANPFNVHPPEVGHQQMGADWAAAYLRNFGQPESVSVTPSNTGATITWNTEGNTSSQVSYGRTSSYTSATTLTDTPPGAVSHTVTLSNLTPGTTYHYQVSSVDQGSKLATSSDLTFTTTGGIININLTGTQSSATITWTTSATTSSQINYGTTASYGNSTPVTDIAPGVTTHSVTLSNLNNCTIYHYQIVSVDGSSNTATSSDQTFGTGGCGGSGGAITTTPSGGGSSAPVTSTFTTTATTTTSTTTTSTIIPLGPDPAVCVAGQLYNILTGALCASATTSSWTPSSASHYTFSKNLSYHMQGTAVLELQQYLASQGFFAATANSIFGPLTYKALMAFQKAHDIRPASGFFGPITRAFVNGQ